MDDARRERLRRHLRLIDDGVAPVVERWGAHIECRPGCSDCCHQSFRVSAIEGELLREGLAALTEHERADILARAQAWRPDARVPCPVLSDAGECRLYDHRPRICRKYGIPLWHPDRPHEVRTCEKNFRGVVDIDADAILEPQAEWARDWIRLHGDCDLGKVAKSTRTIADHLTAVLKNETR
jgi:Fe-S-cluster containining protein